MIEKESDRSTNQPKTYDADLNIYSFMAHYVAKILKLRPNDILDCWGVSELLVAYGIYRNEAQQKAYAEVESYNKTAKKKIPRVNRYAVKFYSKTELEEEYGNSESWSDS